MSEGKRKLMVNCGLACLLNDREGVLDKYDHVTINSGEIVISQAIYAKLNAKGSAFNTAELRVQDIKGEIVQLGKGAVIDGSANLKGFFVIAVDNVLVKKDGVKCLEELEGLISIGTVFYPESASLSSLAKVFAEKRSYPDDAQVILGDQKLENFISTLKGDRKHIWLSGRLSALDKKALGHLRSNKYTVSCGEFFSYENLDEEFGSLINSPERILVPDGYEITGRIRDGELALYGKKLYVDGKFSMTENDITALQELEAIIVKGKASLPSSAVKIFKDKGKAEEYFVFDGRLVEINGMQQFSHSQLETSVKKGEKLNLMVNGFLLFDDDVKEEDIECISSLTYNGTIIVPGLVNLALTQKVKAGHGFMGDRVKFEEMTGKTIKDLAGQLGNDSGDSTINLETYILA
jgi:hypothetical protein